LAVKGRILLPRQTREALSIKPGDELVIEEEGDRITIYDLETFILRRAAEAAGEYRAGGQ
jgi:AbrB family looped-hinge helix DNA binding protein